jgi:hypothetical protein
VAVDPPADQHSHAISSLSFILRDWSNDQLIVLPTNSGEEEFWLSLPIPIAPNDAFPFLPEKAFAVHQPPLLPHPTRLFVKV